MKENSVRFYGSQFMRSTESLDIANSVLERIASIMDAIEINEKGNFKYVGTNSEK